MRETYEDIVQLLQRVQRIPQRELHCGQEVLDALAVQAQNLVGGSTRPQIHSIFNIPITVHADWDRDWELREDGEIIACGHLLEPGGLS